MKIGKKKGHHGLCIPLFSLHSKTSSGIGEIPDLLPIINWMSSIGFDTLQLLPINDSGEDPSPYNALSSCAINPIYLGLRSLPYLQEFPHLLESLDLLNTLNHLKIIPYGAIQQQKETWLNLYFNYVEDRFLKELSLFQKKQKWLAPYATFMAKRYANNNKTWRSWKTDSFDTKVERRVALTQLLLYKQLKEVKKLADEQGLLLMGDTPILTSKNSVDVYQFPKCFDLKWSAGAPPDLFSTNGQNWGFPLFCWNEIKKQKWLFWRLRLSYAEEFYHLFRLDHVIGFFRLWAIPLKGTPKDGCFAPNNFKESLSSGSENLKKITSLTSMLPIGEDLGTVPKQAREIMSSLGILGTKVIRWERAWEEDGHFLPLDEYPEKSLTTVSTHDTESMGEWWMKRKEESSRYALMQGRKWTPLTKKVRLTLLKEAHQTNSCFHINLLNEYLPLFPELMDPDKKEERINVPGTTTESNWCYRFYPSIEEIVSHKALHRTLRSLIN